MKTIYNTYVVMESQEQCDRMKQLCIDNGLSIWSDKCAFWFYETTVNYFRVNYEDKEFANFLTKDNFVEITEQEFIELLKSK